MSRLCASTVWCLLATALAVPSELTAAGRRMAVVVDTSRSMQSNDRERYTAQISKILSDLLERDDELTVIRMPVDGVRSLFGRGAADCGSPASSSLALRHDPSNPAGSKRRIDELITFDTGTYFAAPIRTAIQALSLSADHDHLLLIVADSGGLGPCEAPLTQELSRLRASGATIAAVNLGGAGAFERNPAFAFTRGAQSAHELLAAVALVYQRFLGSKRVQTGRVDGLIQVEIDPHVAEAYLVVAADGPLARLEGVATNPQAAEVDLDYRGGGTTQGLDGRSRDYRIVRLNAPGPGRWGFRATGLDSGAGWMLIQDSALAVRLVSALQAPRGVVTTLEAELYDRVTGRRIDGPCDLPGLAIRAEVEGRQVPFRDDGTGGDRAAGDCTFSADVTFAEAGRRDLVVHLETADLDRTLRIETEVVDLAWRIRTRSSERATAGTPVELAAEMEPTVPAAAAEPPREVVVSAAGAEVARLADDGSGPDETAGDRLYTGSWTPAEPAQVTLEYAARGGAPALGARQAVEVVGVLELGDVPAIRFDPVASGGEAAAVLDLSAARVEGSYEVQATTTFAAARALLEMDAGEGWVPLGRRPVALLLSGTGERRWSLRLRAASCPERVSGDERFEIALSAAGPAGGAVRAAVPVTAVVVPDAWLDCWWPLLALGLGLAVAGVVVHGYWTPSRFPRRLAIQLSFEEDMAEGYPHAIRECRRTDAGFYRDATVFVRDDFRLSGTGRGAVARLRADGNRVRIRPEPGASIWHKTADGDWEPLPAEEIPARFGTVYRNDPPTLFFELRNA